MSGRKLPEGNKPPQFDEMKLAIESLSLLDDAELAEVLSYVPLDIRQYISNLNNFIKVQLNLSEEELKQRKTARNNNNNNNNDVHITTKQSTLFQNDLNKLEQERVAEERARLEQLKQAFIKAETEALTKAHNEMKKKEEEDRQRAQMEAAAAAAKRKAQAEAEAAAIARKAQLEMQAQEMAAMERMLKQKEEEEKRKFILQREQEEKMAKLSSLTARLSSLENALTQQQGALADQQRRQEITRMEQMVQQLSHQERNIEHELTAISSQKNEFAYQLEKLDEALGLKAKQANETTDLEKKAELEKECTKFRSRIDDLSRGLDELRVVMNDLSKKQAAIKEEIKASQAKLEDLRQRG